LASKLKDKKVNEKFKNALEKLSPNMGKHMQEQKQKCIKKLLTKQELANKLHQIFASYIQKPSQHILGETNAYLPDPDKPLPTKHEKEAYLDHISPESRALHKKISDTIKATQIAINHRKPQNEIDELYTQVAEARYQYKQYHQQKQDQQLHHYISSGTLQFQLTGQTVNDAWRFLQQIASKIMRTSAKLPALVYIIRQDGKPQPLRPKQRTTQH
jgi:hypothetical protein